MDMTFFFPEIGSNRSTTAIPGKSDVRDEQLYSAVVAQHGGGGQTKVFTVPQGQAIPNLKGSSINAPVPVHHLLYYELTTNITQAGQLGNGIGDAGIYGIGIDIEQAAFTVTTGVPRAFGATQFEVADLLSKTFFQLRVSSKLQQQSPLRTFPATGGMVSSIASTGNNATVGVASNGIPGQLRRLRVPIMVSRNDLLEGTFGIAGSATLAFSATGSDGQPCLVNFVLRAGIKGDAR